MTGAEIYTEAKTWQTGIASLLGFTGLIVGALWNFHLNRRRDIHLKSEEMRSVAGALYGEIIILRSEIGRVANNVAHMYWNDKRNYEASPFIGDDFLRTNRFSQPLIFNALASKLGLMPVEVTIGITRFYQNYREAEYYLPLLVRRPENKITYTATYVLEPARDAVRDIEQTLRYIGNMLMITETFKKVIVKDVEDIIELEREFFDD